MQKLCQILSTILLPPGRAPHGPALPGLRDHHHTGAQGSLFMEKHEMSIIAKTSIEEL